ncbi:MAG: His/Gly/Thr/Pro-type tRNA ligase C-terminal domain-containing protein, partial [Acidaminococcaceae bacterium]
GRYDGLVGEVGGPATPGIGFAMGMERVLLALEKQNLLPVMTPSIDVFLVAPAAAQLPLAFKTALELRAVGLSTEIDFMGRSMKAQMKQANRLQAKQVLIFGEDEVMRGTVVLRNMQSSEQSEIKIEEIKSILTKTEVLKND